MKTQIRFLPHFAAVTVGIFLIITAVGLIALVSEAKRTAEAKSAHDTQVAEELAMLRSDLGVIGVGTCWLDHRVGQTISLLGDPYLTGSELNEVRLMHEQFADWLAETALKLDRGAQLSCGSRLDVLGRAALALQLYPEKGEELSRLKEAGIAELKSWGLLQALRSPELPAEKRARAIQMLSNVVFEFSFSDEELSGFLTPEEIAQIRAIPLG